MPSRLSFALWVLLVFLGSCQEPVSPLPAVDVTSFPEAVRQVVTTAREAAEAAPDSPGLTLRLGMVMEAHGQLKAALACYRRAYALDAQRFETLYYLGHALAANGETEQAETRLREALALRPDSVPVALKVAEMARDAQLARQLVVKHPNLATAHYVLGRSAMGPAAIAAYEKALVLFPRFGAAQFALAAEYRKEGKAAKAQEALRYYERDKTTTPPVDDPEGVALAEMSTSAPGLLRRAQRAETAGQLTVALELQEQALQQDPGLADAWINLISLRARLVRPTATVEQAYREAVRLAPKRADAHYNYGVFCLQEKRWAEARAAFEKAVELDPRNAEAYLNLGSLAGQEGRLDDAVALFRIAVAARPELARARYHLGQIHAIRRNFKAAREEWKKAREQAAVSGQSQLAGEIAQDLARLP